MTVGAVGIQSSGDKRGILCIEDRIDYIRSHDAIDQFVQGAAIHPPELWRGDDALPGGVLHREQPHAGESVVEANAEVDGEQGPAVLRADPGIRILAAAG